MHIVYAVGYVLLVPATFSALYVAFMLICWGIDSVREMLAECDRVERESEEEVESEQHASHIGDTEDCMAMAKAMASMGAR